MVKQSKIWNKMWIKFVSHKTIKTLKAGFFETNNRTTTSTTTSTTTTAYSIRVKKKKYEKIEINQVKWIQFLKGETIFCRQAIFF